MLKIENVVLPSSGQWAAIIRGMRNPKNSWDRSDSEFWAYEDEFIFGDNDKSLAMTLASGGPVHGKFRRMIPVYLDITAPLYWWKEFDTYKVGTVANSCSTMHKIHAKEFTLEDFSWEHLIDGEGYKGVTMDEKDIPIIKVAPGSSIAPYGFYNRYLLKLLNTCREKYLETKDKKYWWQMIQLLPSSYNQKRTVMLNYEVLSNIYQYRRNHKLDCWHTLCDWIETLPYSELIFANLDLGDEK